MKASHRLECLLQEDYKKLKNLKVAVVGLGGVGGYVVESLTRSFIGTLYLIDPDVVEETNLNRQLIALTDTISKSKARLFEERIHKIHPACKVIVIEEFLTEENMNILSQYPIDYIVDACDTTKTKKELIRFCEQKKIKWIGCMGTALKWQPELLKIEDLRKTSYDPLARPLRKMVKEEKITMKLPVVYSKEEVRHNDDGVLGSAIFVPAVAGIMCANYIVRDWISET